MSQRTQQSPSVELEQKSANDNDRLRDGLVVGTLAAWESGNAPNVSLESTRYSDRTRDCQPSRLAGNLAFNKGNTIVECCPQSMSLPDSSMLIALHNLAAYHANLLTSIRIARETGYGGI